MLYFILTLLIFASLEVVSKPLMPYIDPFALTFWRFFMGFVFFIFYPGMKKRFAEICGDWIDKPQGKPTLVPDSDKRPELSTDDFANVALSE